MPQKDFWILVLWCGLAVLGSSCNKKASPPEVEPIRRPVEAFKLFETYLRTFPFNLDSMQLLLSGLKNNLALSTIKKISFEALSTTVNYRWDPDSSITVVSARKNFPRGFSREEIVHAGDTVLIIHRFSTEPLDIENPEDYTFLESVLILKPTGTIRHLTRIEYQQLDLRDTISFQQMPFSDLTDDVHHYYSTELTYSRNIFRIN